MSYRSLLHRPLLSRRHPLTRKNAAGRISAYIYGNVLILAVLVPIEPDRENFGIAVVLGTAVSTFVAHVFAESIGRQVTEGDQAISKEALLDHLRNSVPILTSALLPCVILVAGLLGWLGPHTAQLAAEVAILARIGGTVFIIDRLNGERPSRTTLLGAVGILVAATIVVVIKVVLTH